METQRVVRERSESKTQDLDGFLASVQGRAYRIAQLATRNKEDALDLVQDAMFKLVEKYSERPAAEWQPLFYRILQSRINDWYRRNSVRSRHQGSLGTADQDLGEDPIQTSKDPNGRTPDQELQTETSMEKLQSALENLPLRQQQAFLLRAWEGLNVKQTAHAMACAEGSVKTHYSRAIHSLREQLGEYWP
ncbi:MAG: RNA polymerase sigma factor [Gammaproteobacteria bacterium]|nr:RNA polymerase sigma factor [Gammaproteobacteria bacterium]